MRSMKRKKLDDKWEKLKEIQKGVAQKAKKAMVTLNMNENSKAALY